MQQGLGGLIPGLEEPPIIVSPGTTFPQQTAILYVEIFGGCDANQINNQ